MPNNVASAENLNLHHRKDSLKSLHSNYIVYQRKEYKGAAGKANNKNVLILCVTTI